MKSIVLLGNITSFFFQNLLKVTLSLTQSTIYIFSKETLEDFIIFPDNINVYQNLTNEDLGNKLLQLNPKSIDLFIALDAVEYGSHLKNLDKSTLKMLVFTGADTRFNRRRFPEKQANLIESLKNADIFGFLSKEHLQEVLHIIDDKPVILLPYGYNAKENNFNDDKNSVLEKNIKKSLPFTISKKILVIDEDNINKTINEIDKLDKALIGNYHFYISTDSAVENIKLTNDNISLLQPEDLSQSSFYESLDLVISYEVNSELKLIKQLIVYKLPLFLVYHQFNLSFEHQSSIFLFSDIEILTSKLVSYFKSDKDIIEKFIKYKNEYIKLHSLDNLMNKIQDTFEVYHRNELLKYHEDLTFDVNHNDMSVFYYDAEIEPTRLSARPMRVRAMRYNLGSAMPCLNIMGNKKTIKRRVNYLERILISDIREVKFIYEESLSSQPRLETQLDSALKIKQLIKKYNLSYGVFLRDIYQGYLELYNLRANKAVDMYHNMVDEFNLNAQIAAKIFVPSPQFANESILRGIVPKRYADKFETLPPAIDARLSVFSSKHIAGSGSLIKIAYTGGLGEFYDFKKFIEALKICYELPIQFDMYVRKNELEASKNIYGDLNQVDNINIYEGAFTDLASNKHYDLGLCLFDANLYRKMAAPVKLFDYLSLSIPVIVGNGTFAEDIIKNDDVGFNIDYTVNDIVGLLISVVENRLLLKKKQSNIINFCNKNIWQDRSELVINCLNKSL